MEQLESPLGRECVIDGRTYLNFAGCGYLGLQNIPEIRQAVHDAYDRWGIAPGISRRYGVRFQPGIDVEAEAARFFGSESARYLVSGFVGNQILIHLAAPNVDYIAADELAHHSFTDAFIQTDLPVHRFKHRDSGDLERLVKEKGGRPLVATDGAFATFGHVAPLKEYWDIIDPRGGWLITDEAHSAGCIGPNRRGAYDAAGLDGERVLVSATLSKAFCAFGGIVLLTAEREEELMRKSPVLMGASEPSVPAMAASAAALQYVSAHPERFVNMDERSRQLRDGFKDLGLDVPDTLLPIVTVAPDGEGETVRIAKGLKDKGIMLQHSFYIGTGPEGALRHTVMASHTEEDITCLLQVWKELLV